MGEFPGAAPTGKTRPVIGTENPIYTRAMEEKNGKVLLRVLTLLCLAGITQSALLTPFGNRTIAITSSENVTFTCMISIDDPHITILWEVLDNQISEGKQQMYADSGICIEDEGRTMSRLVITAKGRNNLNPNQIPVVCYSYNTTKVVNSLTGKSNTSFVIQYGPPDPVGDLKLTHYTEAELQLTWTTPRNIYKDVNVTYLVQITSPSNATPLTKVTKETYIMLENKGESGCQLHNFSVIAMNDAGNSTASPITESIPITPEVSTIEPSYTVELIDKDGVNITLEFQSPTVCNSRFPVLHYIVKIEELRNCSLMLDAKDYDSSIMATISSLQFPNLKSDRKYSVRITACTEFTCKSPKDPLTVFSTDVQSASIAFYGVRIMLSCQLATGSSSTNCTFVFAKVMSREIENITIPYNSTEFCGQLTETRGAYEEDVLVYGDSAQQAIVATVMEETGNFTCPDEDVVVMVESSQGPTLSGGEIAAIVTVAIVIGLTMLTVGLALIFLIIIFCWKKRKGVVELTKHKPFVKIRIKDLDLTPVSGNEDVDGNGDVHEMSSIKPKGADMQAVAKSPQALSANKHGPGAIKADSASRDAELGTSQAPYCDKPVITLKEMSSIKPKGADMQAVAKSPQALSANKHGPGAIKADSASRDAELGTSQAPYCDKPVITLKEMSSIKPKGADMQAVAKSPQALSANKHGPGAIKADSASRDAELGTSQAPYCDKPVITLKFEDLNNPELLHHVLKPDMLARIVRKWNLKSNRKAGDEVPLYCMLDDID